MCVDPISMGLMALSIGGGALGAFGSISAGNANARAAELAAQTAQANAKMALDEGEGRAALVDQRVRQVIGASRAAAGAGNLDIASGSPLMVQALSAQQGNTDRQLALAAGINRAAGMNFAAGQDYQKADQDRLAGWIGAGTSVLNSIGGLRRGIGLGDFGFGGGGGAISNTMNALGFSVGGA
jgi:hypothetical protein